MRTLASKLLRLLEGEKTDFTEDEISILNFMAELSGKLETLENLKDKKDYPWEKEIEKTRKELIEVFKETGMHESEILETVFPKVAGFIDEQKLKQFFEEVRLGLSNPGNNEEI